MNKRHSYRFQTALMCYLGLLTYTLQKDDILKYHSNRYELPRGTYNRTHQVLVHEHEGEIIIMHPRSREILQVHKVVQGEGQLVTLECNDRPVLSSHARSLRDEFIQKLGSTEEAWQFAERICQEMPRYAVDQFEGILEVIRLNEENSSLLQSAVSMCNASGAQTLSSFRGAVETVGGIVKPAEPALEQYYQNARAFEKMDDTLIELEYYKRKEQEEKQKQIAQMRQELIDQEFEKARMEEYYQRVLEANKEG